MSASLGGGGESGALIEESVRGHLETGRHIREVAHGAHVRVNTVRYRLPRFEELTGTSLDAPDTAVELSWALAAREPRTPPRDPAGSAP
ncbi:helix-turn-helix domain-containing protein [Streptomyces sp. NPDC048720]|uniref:helix-turn-helix domain-containing protein n=1 Tax=Streptomyces sp. NPDC048720 TaxID=3365588 RepID=UPI00371C9968